MFGYYLGRTFEFHFSYKLECAVFITSFTAIKGGLAFEGYLEAVSSITSYQLWRKYRKLRVDETLVEAMGPSTEAEVLFDRLVDHAGSKYHGFVMQSIAPLHKTSKKQRFFPTLVAQYHGLSKGGIDLLASYGLLMPSTSFYRERARALTDASNSIRYVLQLLLSFINVW